MSLQPFVNVLKIWGTWRERYLKEHPEKRLIPIVKSTYVALTPKQPIVTPGPVLKEVVSKAYNWGFILFMVAVVALVSRD